jgi:hypothetical protein
MHITLISFPRAVQVSGLFDQLTFVFEVTVIPLDKGVLVWAVWRINPWIDPQTEEKLLQRTFKGLGRNLLRQTKRKVLHLPIGQVQALLGRGMF